MNEQPKNQNPRLHDFETGRSQRRNPGDKAPKKARRVSQRRELAVVTLGAVASITGLGGFLAANPPSWATTPANDAPETVAIAEADPGVATQGDEETQPHETSADSTPASVEPAPVQRQEEAPATPTEQTPPGPPVPSQAAPVEAAPQTPPAPSQAPVEEAAPAWSAPSQAPAAAKSRGS